ncbi:ImmA/IrrE family metallo-endopeptidase [Helicobacter sp. 13S00477-4]|uniref:ImmA/IrrE family metallo-endopeptidase n=1 Tax=Helicobacter sp. 13S00477-4 TaxID=1905759 RepID=UPI000BA50FED|nr:ImmA/IrrE family metallo-endopeptidase [Helicobacter sp. 13S00477-4]PAF51991.1 hypothetical protein BKH44_04845 [Helicobacter sp. 13S00477-4]
MKLEDLKTMLIGKTPEEMIELFEIKDVPIDIKSILRNKLNIKIDEKLDWNKLALDGSVYLKNDYPEIWLNNSVSEGRQNFTLAHELGHIVNDILPNTQNYQDPIKDDYDTLYRRGTGDKQTNRMETKANDFAARFLMPATFIYQEARKLTESEDFDKINLEEVIKRMANRFRVSYEAMKWRLINLGYINKDKL